MNWPSHPDPGSDEQRVAEHRDIYVVWPGLRIGKSDMVGAQRVSEVECLDGLMKRGSKERAELRVRSVGRLAQHRLGFDLLRDLGGIVCRRGNAWNDAQQHLAGNAEQEQC